MQDNIHYPNFKRVEGSIIVQLRRIVGEENVLISNELRAKYGRDETEGLVFMPEIVVKPCETQQISRIMKLCTKYRIPITVRGAGTGLAGGALPVCGGILMSMERFDKILNIDEANYQVTVEPGVVTEVLQNTLKDKGLFYPPDPASRGSSFIGGNVSTNAGGLRAVKYGVVRDYVLNLEIVLPNGEILWTGANTLKNSTGYNLTHLIVGSEGTLAVVTKIVLKLIPHPTHTHVLLVPFDNAEKACAAVAAIFRAGITPSVLEFMERAALEYTMQYLGETTMEIPEQVQAHLLIEVDGFDPNVLQNDCEKIAEVVMNYDAGEILFADDAATQKTLWYLRKNIGRAIKSTIYKELDTVVPRATLPQLLHGLKAIAQNDGLKVLCFGHAGDGNLHVNFVKGNSSDETWNILLPKAVREIFNLVKTLGGTLSGEHGIGWIQLPYMDIMFNETSLNLLRGIKKTFDPKGILNPMKIIPTTHT
jgi:glycolate oxidase